MSGSVTVRALHASMTKWIGLTCSGVDEDRLSLLEVADQLERLES